MRAWMKLRSGYRLAGMATCLVLGACPSPRVFAAAGAANERPVGAGMVREFAATEEEVRQAVQDQVKDQVIHGSKIFDKEPVLSGAEAVNSRAFICPTPRSVVTSGQRAPGGIHPPSVPLTTNS